MNLYIYQIFALFILTVTQFQHRRPSKYIFLLAYILINGFTIYLFKTTDYFYCGLWILIYEFIVVISLICLGATFWLLYQGLKFIYEKLVLLTKTVL